MSNQDRKFNDVLEFIVRARKIGGIGLLEIGMVYEGEMNTSSSILHDDIDRILPYLVMNPDYATNYQGLEAVVTDAGNPAIVWIGEFDLDAARDEDLVAHLQSGEAEEWKQFGYTIGETLLCDLTNGKPRLSVVEGSTTGTVQ